MISLRDCLDTEIPQYAEDVIRAALRTDMGESLVWIVVEDNDDIRDYITTSFNLDYQVIDATNGKEGVFYQDTSNGNVYI